jgi:putative flippase GtrA
MFFLFIEIGLNYVVAVTISTILGILFNFLNFKLFVYKKYNVQNYGLFKFFISYLIQYILNLIGITFLAYLGISYQLAGALMILPLAAFIFIINRVYIFKKE